MMSVNQEAWINDKYYNRVGFISAKQCNFNKENFIKELEYELEDKIKLITDIKESYYRIHKSNEFDKGEYGDYCYKPCEKGKGATLYYYAGFEHIRGDDK